MTDIQLIAIDMDYTLLNDQGKAPEVFEDQVQALKSEGVKVALASGRPLYTLQTMFPNLVDDLVFVSDNGATITYQGEQIFKSIIPTDGYQQLMNDTLHQKQYSSIPILCGLDAAYIPKVHNQYDNTYRDFYTIIHYYDNFDHVDTVANKFTIFTPDKDSVEQYHAYYNEAWGDQFSVTTSGQEWIDVMNKNIDKGRGMQELSKLFNIPTDNMMAFGDNYNDIEMLSTVKYSFAMANAHENIKQHANFQAPSNNDQGVAQIIQKVLDGKLA